MVRILGSIGINKKREGDFGCQETEKDGPIQGQQV